MKYIELPLSSPSIKTFQYHAFQFAITDNYKKTFPWKYSNYIQLFCNTDIREQNLFNVDFYPSYHNYPMLNPWIIKKEYSKNSLNNFKINIKQFIINELEKNRYVYIFIDEYYIPNKMAYNRCHYFHDCLVSGININEDFAIISGYDYSSKYSTWKISIDDIEKGFYSTQTNKNIDPEYFDSIYSYRFRNDFEYDFDINYMCNLINDYLYSINSEVNLSMYKNLSDNRAFGISVYNYFKDYLLELGYEKVEYDLRPFCLLKEHKQLMLERISYLENKNYLDNSYYQQYEKYVVLQVSLVFNKLIKYSLDKNNNLILSIIENFDNIFFYEKQILSNIYYKLINSKK